MAPPEEDVVLEIYFETPYTLNRLRSGPSGPYVDGFSQRLSDVGYGWHTSRRHLRAASHLGRFVELEETDIGHVDNNVVDAFHAHLPRCECPQANGGTTMDVVWGARAFVEYLRSIGVVTSINRDSTRDEPQLVESFRAWLQQHKNVADSTLYHYCRSAAELVDKLGDDTSEYTADSLRRFILDTNRSGPGATKNLIAGVRAFLRYLASEGKCCEGLDQAVPAVARWRLAPLPHALSPTEVDRMLEACDTKTSMGARDQSIILLLARLGLRAGDVAGLRLRDIDWEDGSFVVAGKTRREVRLPLSQEVGDAVLKYLMLRPKVEADRLYLSERAPLSALKTSRAVSAIIARAIRRAGISAPSYGAHILRHSAATQMLNEGASVYEVGAVLRHRSTDMTAHYAKVDTTLLKEIAQPWPEVMGC